MKKIIHVILIVIAFSFFPKATFAQQANSTYTITDNANWRQGQIVPATTVNETYSYNSATDTVSINFQFNQTGFAPLPPMLALAYKYLPATNPFFRVNKTLQDTGKTSVLGPLIGVPNTDNYTLEFTGLSHYVTSQRVLGLGPQPAAVQQKLESEVNKIISAGHLRPALFLSNVPGGGSNARGVIHWYAPSDTLYFLSEVYPLIPTNLQNNVKTYLQNERQTYKPEMLKSLPFTTGTSRFEFEKSDDVLANAGDYSWYNGFMKFRTQGNPKVASLYGLSDYYQLLGLVPTASEISSFTTIVNNEFNSYRDWATMYWQSGHWPEYNAVHAVNQLFAGLVGYVRLARLSGNQTAENLGWGLLAKMTALRFAMGKYTQFDWDRGIRPSGFSATDPAWWAKYRSQYVDNWAAGQVIAWRGELITFNWTKGIDNVRQVHRLDDKGVDTWEYYSSTDQADGQATGQDKSNTWCSVTCGPYLLPFVDITPELGRFLKDYLKPEVQTFVNRVIENKPNWYQAYSEALVGQEINYSMPSDSFGVFMANAWVLGATADDLNHYTDNSWLKVGDYFYLNKLSETIKAYKGVTWSDQPVGPSPTPGSPTPTTPPACIADIDGSHTVGIGDLQMVLSNFGSISNTQVDINKDQKVNILDAGYVIKYWNQPC